MILFNYLNKYFHDNKYYHDKYFPYKNLHIVVRFEALTVLTVKITVTYYVMPLWSL